MSARFDDGKDDGALRTIGEVSTALGIKTHVLRYWEQQFPSLQPLKRSGRRYYRSEDIVLLETIDQLVNRDGYTLKGAQQAIKGGRIAETGVFAAGTEPPQSASPMAEANSSSKDRGDVPASVSPEVIAQLKAIRAKLAAAIA